MIAALGLSWRSAAAGLEHALGGGWELGQQASRSHRARRKAAAAVGAHAVQFVRRTAGAEGALEGADHGRRVGRQVAVAAFAVGAQLQHEGLQIGQGWLLHHAIGQLAAWPARLSLTVS